MNFLQQFGLGRIASIIRHSTFVLGAALSLVTTALPPARAQDSLGDLLFTVGTTYTDTHAREWAYLYWNATSSDILLGRQFAIYVKSGGASSASPFARTAIIARQADVRVIDPLVNRGVNLGDDAATLQADLEKLFENLIPAGTITLAEKLSAVLRGASGDARHYQNLILLSRLHSSVALALGIGYAEVVPGPAGTQTTFEIREWDPVAMRDRRVIGRVTVTANQPTILPAPGDIAEYTDTSAKGHLNAKLRWSTPDALRRLSLLGHGFNIWRMDGAAAIAGGFVATPPTRAQLAAMYATNAVRRVNALPIMATKDFDASSVTNFSASGDTNTFFVIDNNDAFRAGGSSFADGQSVCYFVTARDLLGRDGQVSKGKLITICDRMPPNAPRRVHVRNNYEYNATGVQKLRVDWEANAQDAAETPSAYYIYRWDNIPQMHTLGVSPGAHLIGAVTHTNGVTRYSFLDSAAGSPALPADADKAFWYTVRVADNGYCGNNLSAHSAPAWGVLRNRYGPGSPTVTVNLRCVRPIAAYVPPATLSSNGTIVPGLDNYRLGIQRLRLEIQWAEFFTNSPAGPGLVGTVTIPPGTNRASIDVALPKNTGNDNGREFLCRVGTADGRVSTFASGIAPVFQGPYFEVVRFTGDLIVTQGKAGDDCRTHTVTLPSGLGSGSATSSISGIKLDLTLPAGTAEYKVYRRINEGPLTMICQADETHFTGVLTGTCYDDTMPSTPCTVCYYVQCFDRNGNSGPLTRTECIDIAAPLPVPMLSKLDACSTNSALTQMKVSWVCSPYGVERFRIYVASPTAPFSGVKGLGINTNSGEILSENATVTISGVSSNLSFRGYKTLFVGPAFGSNASFSTCIDVESGRQYFVFVKAIGNHGTSLGDASNIESFQYAPVATNLTYSDPVPWPARGLPLTNSVFHSSLNVTQLTVNSGPVPWRGIGIHIGEYHADLNYLTNFAVQVYGVKSTTDYLYVGTNGSTILPLAAYRYQVPNTNYAVTSGDLIQVSPLMEEIAYGVAGTNSIVIRDPFVQLVQRQDNSGNSDLYLADTQPVVAGARYRYLLVRFKTNHEIDQVIPAGEVEVVP